MKEKIIIYGERGVGKSTLVARLLGQCIVPVYGFVTRAAPRDEAGFQTIHLYPAGAPTGAADERNCVGRANHRRDREFPEVFDTLGVSLLRANPDGIVVMDELGFMERDAKVFRAAVLARLDDDIPVLAVIKAKGGIPFLQEIREHPNVQLYHLTEENREALFYTLLPVIRRWNHRAYTSGKA